MVNHKKIKFISLKRELDVKEYSNSFNKIKRLCLSEHNSHTNDHSRRSKEEDLLSALPNCILNEILSRLPVNYAVATSGLSRRWRHLWTQLTHLNLDLNHFPLHIIFFTAINDIDPELRLPEIRSCSISLSETLAPKDIEVCSVFLSSWIPQIYARNPEVVTISIHQDSVISLPSSLFRSSSLVELSLGTDVKYQSLDDGVISLPMLKKLQMETNCKSHLALMTMLLKSCPQLEDLVLRSHMGERKHPAEISSPNLKHLCVENFMVRKRKSCVYMIDAPKLEHIKIEGDLAFYDFVKIPSRLVTAEISLSDTPVKMKDDEHWFMILGLFQGISCVRTLILSGYTLSVFRSVNFGGELGVPSFDNLVHLGLTNLSKQELNWSIPLPVCLLRKLRIAYVSEVKDDINGTHLLDYILRNASVLEQLIVRFAGLGTWVRRSNDGEWVRLLKAHLILLDDCLSQVLLKDYVL